MFQIWHNPRCTKSRQALQVLQEKKVDFEIFEYLKTPPSEEDIEDILIMLDKRPIEITRTKEDLFQELELSLDDEDEVIIKALSKNPKLIERPIVIKNNEEAVIGRPSENILALL